MPETEQKEGQQAGGEQKGSEERIYTQADVDRRVTQAMKTAEEKKAREIALAEAKAKGDMESLYNQTRTELETVKEQVERERAIREHGLADFADALGSVPASRIPEIGKAMKTAAEKRAEDLVRERLKGGSAGQVPGTPGAKKAIKDMTPEEYKAWKQANHIQ